MVSEIIYTDSGNEVAKQVFMFYLPGMIDDHDRTKLLILFFIRRESPYIILKRTRFH